MENFTGLPVPLATPYQPVRPRLTAVTAGRRSHLPPANENWPRLDVARTGLRQQVAENSEFLQASNAIGNSKPIILSQVQPFSPLQPAKHCGRLRGTRGHPVPVLSLQPSEVLVLIVRKQIAASIGTFRCHNARMLDRSSIRLP